MKQLFLLLLKRYMKTEKNRLMIYSKLHDKMSDVYNEQTPFGNVYNAHTEFVMANSLIKKFVKEGDQSALLVVKKGINNAFEKGLEYIKNENIK